MGLNTQLSAMYQDFVSRADPEVLTVMKNTKQRLIDSGLHLNALSRGETMPDFELQDTNGQTFSSQQARTKGPLLLCWYRGIW